MRLFILLALIFLTAPLNAQAKEITKAMADQYYNSCLSKPTSQPMSKENKDYLCACTAVQMMETMTTDRIAAMRGVGPSVREAFHYMLVNVYAPCMEYPAKDHYYNTCISNPKTATLGQDPAQLCGCMADKAAAHLGQNGKELFQDILARNPNAQDPMSLLESDPQFQSYVGQQVLGCVL